MKKLLTILFLAFCFHAFSQPTITGQNPVKVSQAQIFLDWVRITGVPYAGETDTTDTLATKRYVRSLAFDTMFYSNDTLYWYKGGAGYYTIIPGAEGNVDSVKAGWGMNFPAITYVGFVTADSSKLVPRNDSNIIKGYITLSYFDSVTSGNKTITWSVLDSLSTPAVSPPNDSVYYLVGTAPTGAFTGHANQIAQWDSAQAKYTFFIPSAGQLLLNLSDFIVSEWTGISWVRVSALLIHEGGDAFGAPFVIGSKDNQPVQMLVNNTVKLQLRTTGQVDIFNAPSVNLYNYGAYTAYDGSGIQKISFAAISGSGSYISMNGTDGQNNYLTPYAWAITDPANNGFNFTYQSGSTSLSGFRINSLGQWKWLSSLYQNPLYDDHRHALVTDANGFMYLDTIYGGGSGTIGGGNFPGTQEVVYTTASNKVYSSSLFTTDSVGRNLITRGSDEIIDSTTNAFKIGSVRALYKVGSNYFVAGAGNTTVTGTNNYGAMPGALASLTSGSQNTVTGYQADGADTNTTGTTSYGYQALFSSKTNISSQPDVAFGYQPLYSALIQSDDVAIGLSPLYTQNSQYPSYQGFGSIAIGESPLYSAIVSVNNIAIGSSGPLALMQAGENDVAIGFSSQGEINCCGSPSDFTLSSDNTSTGSESMSSTSQGIDNTVTGYNTGANMGNEGIASYNTVGGSQSMFSPGADLVNGNFYYNSVFGDSAFYGNTIKDSFSYNTGIGARIAVNIENGQWNTLAGYYSGHDSLTINNHIVLAGDSTDVTDRTVNYTVALGTKAKGLSNYLVLSPYITHESFNLDSAIGSAPNLVGIDASNHWHRYVLPASSGGTVTSVATGYGLTGGTITTSGTIVADTTKLIPYTDTFKTNGIATQTWVKNQGYLSSISTLTFNSTNFSGASSYNGSSPVTLNTVQNINTTAAPQFARLRLGVAADGTSPLKINGLLAGSGTPTILVHNTDSTIQQLPYSTFQPALPSLTNYQRTLFSSALYNTAIWSQETIFGDTLKNTFTQDTSLFEGNSITAGAGVSTSSERFSTRVATELNTNEVNEGIGSTTLEQFSMGDSSAVNRLFWLPYKYNTHVAGWWFLEYGTNDIGHNDTSGFRAAAIQVIDTGIARGWPTNKIVVISIPYSTTNSASVITEYNTILQQVCTSKNVIYADVYTPMLKSGDTSLVHGDGTHPTDYGASILANAILASVTTRPHGTNINLYGYIDLNHLNAKGTPITSTSSETIEEGYDSIHIGTRKFGSNGNDTFALATAGALDVNMSHAYWNDTATFANKVGFGTLAPIYSLTFDSANALSGMAINTRVDQVTNYKTLREYYTGGLFTIASYAGGTQSPAGIQIGAAPAANDPITRVFTINPSTSSSEGFFDWNTGLATDLHPMYTFQGSYSAGSGTQVMLSLQPEENYYTSGGISVLRVQPWKYSFSGTGLKNLIDAGTDAGSVGGTFTEEFHVNDQGGGYFQSLVGIGKYVPGAFLDINDTLNTSADLQRWERSGTVESSVDSNGNFRLNAVGRKLIIATGTNGSVNTATLSSGTVTISNTAVTASSLIHVEYAPAGQSLGVGGTSTFYVSSLTAGTGFTIVAQVPATAATNTTDNSTIYWWFIN